MVDRRRLLPRGYFRAVDIPAYLRVVTSDSLEIAVYDLGGAGPNVLMAHATGFHGRIFAPLASELADRFHAFSFDERGHGDSASPRNRDFSWNGFAADVLAVVESVGAPLLAIGHSAGAAALLLAEPQRPGTFRGLYCWEPVMFPSDPPMGHQMGNFLAEGARKRREIFASRDEAFQNFSSKLPFSSLFPSALHAYVDYGFRDLPDGSVRLKCDRDDEALVYENGGVHDAFTHLSEVKCPTTIACGEKTQALGPVIIRGFAERMPDAKAIVVPDLGHFGPLEDPVAVAESIKEAFNGLG